MWSPARAWHSPATPGPMISERQSELTGLAPLLGQGLGEVEREGRRRGNRVRPEILQQEMVARGVPGGDRYHGHADALGAVVEAEPAREEPVAEGDVEQVAAVRARGRHHARHHLTPDVEVAGGVGDDRGLALGPGGGVDPSELGARNRQEAERVLLAQIRLPDERKGGEVREPLEPGSAQPVPVKRHARDGPADRLLEPLELQALARPARHRLGLAVPDQPGGSARPCSWRSRRISSRISRSAIPGTTSRTTSSHPGALTATAGRPQAAASARTRPCVSVSEAKRNTSAA